MASITASRAPTSAQPDVSSTHPYTCNTCQVAFRNSELQRGHMRSDWHRYNLKRRVTSLPPISSEVFTEKVLQAQASNSAAASKAAYEKTCTVCVRTYFSENAYQNHMGSAKHKAKLAYAGSRSVNDDASSVMSSTFSLGEPAVANDDDDGVNSVANGIKNAGLKDTSSVAGPSKAATGDGEGSVQTASSVTAADDEIPHETALKRCLFCNYESPSMELSVNHMEKIHGMFVPERPYLVNLEGLVSSLHEKIYEYHECLYCGKLKPTVFGLQTHMRDKGHCKIPFGTEDEQLEIGEFYDFTSTYSDVEDESDDENELPGKKKSGGAKLGARRKAKVADGEGDEDMEEGDGWETDSSASSLDSADLTAVPLDDRQHQYEKLHEHPHHAHTDPRPHHNKDGWHSHAHKHNHAAFYTDYELHLPSGRTAGHRSLNKYFKQNMNGRSPAERQEQEQLRIEAGSSDSDEVMEDGQVARQNGGRGRAVVSRANGGLGMVGVSDEKRREVKLEEKRARKVEQREQRKFQWGNNKQGNFQKHFRDPLLQ